jgi:putative transposase
LKRGSRSAWRASVCADFEAELVKFDDEDDHAHLQVNYLPEVAVSAWAKQQSRHYSNLRGSLRVVFGSRVHA